MRASRTACYWAWADQVCARKSCASRLARLTAFLICTFWIQLIQRKSARLKTESISLRRYFSFQASRGQRSSQISSNNTSTRERKKQWELIRLAAVLSRLPIRDRSYEKKPRGKTSERYFWAFRQLADATQRFPILVWRPLRQWALMSAGFWIARAKW